MIESRLPREAERFGSSLGVGLPDRTTSPVVVGASFRASAESNRDHAKNFHPDRFASEKFRHLSSAFSLLGAPSIISPIGFAGNPIGFRKRWSRKVRPSHWPNLFARFAPQLDARKLPLIFESLNDGVEFGEFFSRNWSRLLHHSLYRHQLKEVPAPYLSAFINPPHRPHRLQHIEAASKPGRIPNQSSARQQQWR